MMMLGRRKTGLKAALKEESQLIIDSRGLE